MPDSDFFHYVAWVVPSQDSSSHDFKLTCLRASPSGWNTRSIETVEHAGNFEFSHWISDLLGGCSALYCNDGCQSMMSKNRCIAKLSWSVIVLEIFIVGDDFFKKKFHEPVNPHPGYQFSNISESSGSGLVVTFEKLLYNSVALRWGTQPCERHAGRARVSSWPRLIIYESIVIYFSR